MIHYRKRDPWPWAEKGWTSPGDLGNPVVDTSYGRLGLLVCYDIHEQAEIMANLKVDPLLYSVAWVEDKDSKWFDRELPEIVQKHGLNIVAVNWIIPQTWARGWHGHGQSRLISASGEVVIKSRRGFGGRLFWVS